MTRTTDFLYNPHEDPADPSTWEENDPREQARRRAMARNGGGRGYTPYDQVAATIRQQPDAATRERMWAEYDRTGHVTPPRKAINPGTLTPTDHDIVIRHPEDPATDAQVNFLSSLVAKLSKIKPDVADQADRWIQGHYRAGTFTKGMASDAINRIKGHLGDDNRPTSPASAMAPATTPRVQVDRFEDIPVGYYAYRTNDVAHFYRVTRHEDTGRWYVQEQASDNLYPVRNFAQAKAVMEAIRAGSPKVCAELYAELIGRCYVCGRTLTDEDSRAAGIGPVCAARGGGF